MNMPIPRPGQHRVDQHRADQHAARPNHAFESSSTFADPERIHSEVDALLGRLGDRASVADGRLESIPDQARILEQAHDVLVQALATVDKI